MTSDDVYKFHELMAMLVAFFPHSPVNLEVVTEAYFEELAGLTMAQVDAVFRQALRQCRFFPTLAELLEIAVTLRQEERHQERLHETARANARLSEAPWPTVPWEEIHRLLEHATRGMPPLRSPGGEPEPTAPNTVARRQLLKAQLAYMQGQPLTAEQAALLRTAGLRLQGEEDQEEAGAT